MQKLLLLGDEAIAQGAIDGGISGFYAYPGTPSTEIMEYAQHSKEVKEKGIHAIWSANEKTATESAIGMSYAGKRAMAQMKHVGLNVAADAFINASITGVNGGLIIVAADDPSMHSSQNEQDSRFYGDFALIPILEPCDQQEAYDMAYNGFELSEKFNVPVLLRITTRLAHSRAGVSTYEKKEQLKGALPKDPRQFVLLPSIARRNYKRLLEMQPAILKDSEESKYNKYIDASDKSLGIVACGIAYNYLMEIFNGNCPYPVVKISQYPIPEKHLRKLRSKCSSILVLEDGYPFVERQLRGFFNEGFEIKGRLTGDLPRDGELNPNLVAKALGRELCEGQQTPEIVKMRPPSLCMGCGHRDVYNALNEAIAEYGEGRVFSDIGCYTLGALPPFNAINSCVDMGASITMAIGAADAGLVPSVAVIGDSTFTHSGMTGLLDAVVKNSPIVVIISDNSTTGMTGGQESSAKGRIVNICRGIGVHPDHIRVITPLKKNHDENVAIIKEELAYNGLSVIIPQRECIQTAVKNKKEAKK
ncbi:MAG TPA: indolepyruvate ferredoxin oxidoreductase subunit alpha [Bacteroidales bacterium]|nr:indolepyruvate ferredoxin oxidoreductase subunit alpha [Bacteroidales bacterium]HOL98600.1 indolepyruvate ferredoxin oxidoreductase subunit alpha [Bacteroidales bacterium]HOM36926.1 indolepyruvate ferredoxin oxidoreductase subunit alpha [Bacteroidales bacterium]HPD24404.1 indolepyruvate ferredoxin oxidoreductase subunit alpha [Bacteroidales bacterium]HRT00296.1 indolepyruvate ferredoxin oxidoreductase subunit alpha [Bacteroidales bacterium]